MYDDPQPLAVVLLGKDLLKLTRDDIDDHGTGLLALGTVG